MADDHGTAARRMDFGESVHLPWITDPESSDRRQFAGLSHDFQEGGGLSWMNDSQRKAHIEHQRKLRGFYNGKGQANSAIEIGDPYADYADAAKIATS